MTLKISTALEWQDCRARLRDQLGLIDYNTDLHKMLLNIDTMVRDLSKLEVEARRAHNSAISQQQCNSVNAAIAQLERLIVLALLLK